MTFQSWAIRDRQDISNISNSEYGVYANLLSLYTNGKMLMNRLFIMFKVNIYL